MIIKYQNRTLGASPFGNTNARKKRKKKTLLQHERT